MRLTVLDLETQKVFSEVGGKGKPHELKVSVAGLYDSETDSYTTYEEHELPTLEGILKKADLIIGFNIRHFDLPVLQPYLLSPIEQLPVLDLLEEIHASRGHRVTLQSLVVGTLNDTKSGKGYDAVTLYREGRFEELKKYCLDDVRLTKEVFDYGRKHGKVFFVSNLDHNKHEIPASWKDLTPFLKKKESFPFHSCG